MNAAAKMIHQSTVFNGQFSAIRLSARLFVQILLLFAVLLSALAVVYVTNQHRITCSQLQRAEHKSHELQLQWGQLLLEQASLATPARVRQLASERLNMTMPAQQSIQMYRLK